MVKAGGIEIMLRSSCLKCGGIVPFEPKHRQSDSFGNNFFRCPLCDAKNIVEKKFLEKEGIDHYVIVRFTDD